MPCGYGPWDLIHFIVTVLERLLAGRISAVNREFVYIDFDDERFPPCEGGEEVTEGASGRGKERRRKEGHNHLRFEAKNIDFL